MTQREKRGKAVAHASREITLTKKNIGSAAMIVWRIAGWGALLAGLSVLVRDVIAWFDTRVWAPLALGQLWYELEPVESEPRPGGHPALHLRVFVGPGHRQYLVMLGLRGADRIGRSDPAARAQTPASPFLIGNR